MNERDFFILGGHLMHDEIEARLREDPNALAPRHTLVYPWGAALRERADARVDGGCRDEEFVAVRDGAWRELEQAQRDYDKAHNYDRQYAEQAYLPLRTLQWSVDMGEMYAQREIDAYVDAGGPENEEWSWEPSYNRLKEFLDTRFNSGPCHLEAAQARNKYLIRWSESDHPDAVRLREYAAKLPLFAPVPCDEAGNIGVTPCVIAGKVTSNSYGGESVRVVLPLGFKWSSLNRHQLMELKPEAGPPRFFGDNWIVYTPEREGSEIERAEADKAVEEFAELSHVQNVLADLEHQWKEPHSGYQSPDHEVMAKVRTDWAKLARADAKREKARRASWM